MKQATMNLLFFLGVLIPALITVALFVIFCFCWYKIRIRNEILYKKHDPHKIEQLKDGEIYEAPPPPPPPFRSPFSELENYNNNNENKNKSDNYEESPEPTDGLSNPTMYRTAPDSGFSDLNHIQCDLDGDHAGRDHARDRDRPSSQASDDSDDSGFRSSRSGQYIHSASSSTGNAQECVPSSNGYQMRDAVPLFQPIKVHPNEHGQPSQGYVFRNSSKHKRHKHRSQIPSSQHYNSDTLTTNPDHITPQANTGHMHACDNLPPYHDLNSASESNCDVHGGRLHSINSHVRPVHSIGNFGHLNSDGHCDHSPRINSYCGDHHYGPLDSLGYGSDQQSINYRHSVGYGPLESTGHPHMAPISHISLSNPISGYSPIRTTELDLHVQKLHPLRTIPEMPMPLTITQAMVHRPYIEELSDPTLFSVV